MEEISKFEIDKILGVKLKYQNRLIWIIIVFIIIFIVFIVFLITTGYIKINDPVNE